MLNCPELMIHDPLSDPTLLSPRQNQQPVCSGCLSTETIWSKIAKEEYRCEGQGKREPQLTKTATSKCGTACREGQRICRLVQCQVAFETGCPRRAKLLPEVGSTIAKSPLLACLQKWPRSPLLFHTQLAGCNLHRVLQIPRIAPREAPLRLHCLTVCLQCSSMLYHPCVRTSFLPIVCRHLIQSLPYP